MKKTIFIIIALLAANLTFSQSETDYIEKILKKLNEIKTAEYYTQITMSDVRDAVPVRTIDRYVKMYTNPADSLFGAGFMHSYNKDFTRYDMCYDGKYIVNFEWKDKIVQIDTLTNISSPGLIAPFLIRVRALLDYAMDHKNNVEISLKDLKDSVRIEFYFPEKAAYFTKVTPLIHPSPNKFSRYVLWVNKADNIPYKLIRSMPTQKFRETCSELKINKETSRQFDATKKIPDDFSILSEEEMPKKGIIFLN